MFNTKTHNADSKNNTGDSKHHNADSKNNNADSKMNRADSRNNKSDSKNNKSDSKNNNADLKNNPDSKTNVDAPSHGDGGRDNMPPSSAAAQPFHRAHNGNKVYKSGPLFLSSKGIGWTSWKKRWFILTETSLVFFRSDPNAAPQKGVEANLTLGGIDLNSSGSVVVKADKKLLTVLFPDGRDGRSFTLKAETTEDLFEWKDALEAALANAPSAGTGPGQNGLSKNDKGDTADGSQEQSKDQPPAKPGVLGRPILLALEDMDGTPSFLEKALCYVEDYGINVEGILRQAADVDDVERRICEYEQGKTEFTAKEDGHVIGDCIKYVLRELPSPPVPASCCAALLEAYRADRATRVSAMRAAICDTFPEPNRRLLQRILIMMEAVADNKAVNRMSVSAVAACMSPLLLRPLLAGEVDLGKGPDMGGDGSVQLLQAAAAANHAQAIVITLIEEYDKIFGEEDMLSDPYSDSDEYGSESEELSDEYYEEDESYEDDEDVENLSEGSCSYEDSEHGSSISCSESGDDGDGSRDHAKVSIRSISISNEVTDNLEVSNSHSKKQANESKDDIAQDSITRRHTIRRRSSAKKSSPLESIQLVIEQQAEILRLEAMKAKLKERVEAEARRNAILKEDLVTKKNALEVRRVSLLQEVSKLEEELQETCGQSQGGMPLSVTSDEKTNADPDNIDQSEADDTGLQQNQQNSNVTRDSCYLSPPSPDRGKVKDQEKDRESTTTSHKKRNERGMSKSSSSKKSHSKGEAANTTSALSKITNRLNFLKEKRNQIADELQHVDKDNKSNKHNRGSRKWSESSQMSDESSNTQSSDKGKGSESSHHHAQKETSFHQRESNMDKGRPEDEPTNQAQGRTYSR